MSETNGLIRQTAETWQETISILERLREKASEFELPAPPETLEHYRDKLEENTYKVLVVGETKKGKSTFVNALLGEDILPTNVRVSTSQVFNVRQTEDEAYRLRFEDGSVREVVPEDLPRYGSQVLEDAGERPKLDQIIRWIEVDRPGIRFLPGGVSLLDTPGLGALYAAHAQITQRFVPEADAVIFVLDSEKPIVQTEVEFIETILEQTSDIFFIQTKIDLFDEEAWKETQRRNREILEEKFGERLTDARIWPISSELLQKAAASEATRDLFLEKSLYDELATALQAFLFRVAGWRRSAEAMLTAEGYYSSARNTLSTRLAGLTEDAKKRGEMQQRAAERRKKFDEEWGPRGHKQKELVDETRKAIKAGRKSFERFLSPEGEIVLDQKDRIDAVTSLKEANALGEKMYGDVVSATTKKWQETCANVEARCVDLLGPFLNDAETLGGTLGTDLVKKKPLEGFKEDWYVRIKALRMNLFVGMGFSTVLLFTPLAPLAPIPLLWSTWRGWKAGTEEQVKQAQQKLQIHLSRVVMPEVKRCFLDPDISATSHRESMVQEYFASVERAMIEQVQKIGNQKEEEAKAEHNRLVEAGKLDEQQRKERVEHTKRQLAEWDEIGKSIESAAAKLNALDQPPAVPTAR